MTTRFELIDTFSRRPSLSSVAATALKRALETQFPTVAIDPDVAAVSESGQSVAESLTTALRTNFATGKTLRWTTGRHRLVADPAATTPLVLTVDVEQLAVLIDSVSLDLATAFSRDLVNFWEQAGPQGANPGKCLADELARQGGSSSGAATGDRQALFERKALQVLDAQLRVIARVRTLELNDFDEIERYLAKVTDIAPLLDDRQAMKIAPRVSTLDQLPDWLSKASSADRLDYSRRMTSLAVVAVRAEGKGWDDDLPPLVEYARKVLQEALRTENPTVTWLTLDDVTVHIAKVVAAPVPSTGEITAVGSVEHLQMSVAMFALGNLASVPSGTITLSMRDGGPMPVWLTVDYLKRLVVRVDIGSAYPALISQYLITDPTESARRQALFASQLRVQLPLKALEQKIRGEGHLTPSGYRRVCSLMEDSSGGRAVLRPLAWLAQPGAQADEVCNMFVIGAADTAVGPFILYRPFAPVPLTEFASWSALRQAIATVGTLQDEVLAWMTDQGRPRYANGGFAQPHIVRFGLGSDFAPLEVPAPAQLSAAQVKGDIFEALFKANARALVELADRESVSNVESRWAMIERGGWLALDAVMPFLSGAVGTALWLVQLMIAVDRALVAQSRKTGSEGAEAWYSLLLTLSMILLHQGFKSGIEPVPAVSEFGSTPVESSRETAVPASIETSSVSGTSTLLSWDFSWSSLSHQLSVSQKQQLERWKIVPEPRLGTPSTMVGKEGLYQHDGHWRVKLDSGVYEVGFVDGQVCVVDPQTPQTHGPRLKRVGQTWTVDLSLGLRGGGPKRNVRQMAQENAANLKRVTERDAVLETRKMALYQKFVGWDKTQRSTTGQVPAGIYDLIEKDLNELQSIFEERDQLQRTLRVADRIGDKTMGDDLQAIARRIAFLEGVLLHNSVRLAQTTLTTLHADSDGNVSVGNVAAYLALFEDLVKLQDRAVHWSSTRETLWQRLRAVPKVGEGLWRDEVMELQSNNLFTHLAWRVDRMWSLLELSFTRQDILSGLGDQRLKAMRTDDPLHAAFSSQSELDKPNDYTLAEQIEVLESSLREYQRFTLIANDAKERSLGTLNATHFERFFSDLTWIVEQAEKRLSELVRESAEPSERPLAYAPRVKQSRQRIIRTRGHRTLVGRLRNGEPGTSGAVVEVTRTMSDSVVGTYHEHATGEWVEVETVRPSRPSGGKVSVALAELKRQATGALDQVERDINIARSQSRRNYEPADVQGILASKADHLTGLADKLAVHVVETRQGETAVDPVRALSDRLRSEASRLISEGRSLRIAMIKAQPPTATRLDYLATQHEVDVARFDGRKNMSGAKRNDFLQEYVIRNKDRSVLWWAHFHYPSEAAADASFTAAHLKLPDQRFIGYSAQVKAAKENREVVSIYRSYIGKDIAQRLFLHL